MGSIIFKRVAIVGKDIAQARIFFPTLKLFSKKGFGAVMTGAGNFSEVFRFFEAQKPAFIFFHQDVKDKNPDAFDLLKKALDALLPTAKIFEFKTEPELRVLVLEQTEILGAPNGIQKY